MMNYNSQEIGVRNTGYQASGPAVAVPVSEIDRETQNIDEKLTYLENVVRVLRDRLKPVILNSPDANEGAMVGQIPPSSDLGGQLRAYANRTQSISESVDYLLEHLALA